MKQRVHQFVFGYGSLICPHSRALTFPETSQRSVIPVAVRGVERWWGKRSVRGMTAVGVRFHPKASCLGVLLPVSDHEVALFDEREVGYSRKSVSVDCVDLLDFVNYKEFPGHHLLASCLHEDSPERARIWVYAQNQTLPCSVDYPIAQSYLDTIIRGCWSIHPKLALEFLRETKGWSFEDFDGTDLRDDERVTSERSESSGVNVWWVDDRHDPIYKRGDPVWSLRSARKVDALLQQHRRDQVSMRMPKPSMRKPKE